MNYTMYKEFNEGMFTASLRKLSIKKTRLAVTRKFCNRERLREIT